MKHIIMQRILTATVFVGVVVVAGCDGGAAGVGEPKEILEGEFDTRSQAIVDMCAADGVDEGVCTCTAGVLRDTLDEKNFDALADFAGAINKAEGEEARAAILMGVLGNPGLISAFAEIEAAEKRCTQTAALEEMGKQVAAAEAARQERRERVSSERKCPHKSVMGPRGPGAAVDDVAELRPGMSFEDVEAILECRGDIFNFDLAREWARRSQGLETRQILRAADGDICQAEARAAGGRGCEDGGYGFELLHNVTQEFIVAFTGMPGAERAGIIWRRTVFPEEQYPTVSSLTEALTVKYGRPHLRATEEGYYSLGHRRGSISHSWIYLPNGAPVPDGDSTLRSRCVNGPRPTFHRQMNWNPGCGLTVRAEIVPAVGNTLLARELNVMVMDQKRFNDAVRQFEFDITAALEAEHRDRGVKPDL